jgi:hypothetical protein
VPENSIGLRLASLARVATDYGARSVAVHALDRLCEGIFQSKEVDLTEPFLAPSERFDSIRPGNSIGDWVMAAALEQLEHLDSYSSFFNARRHAATARYDRRPWLWPATK